MTSEAQKYFKISLYFSRSPRFNCLTVAGEEPKTERKKERRMSTKVKETTAPVRRDSATLSPSHIPGKFNMVSHRSSFFINSYPLTREEAVSLAEFLNIHLVLPS